MKILVISDAWKPQVNGVVRTYECLATALAAQGHDLHVIGPADFRWRMRLPSYAEIELALCAYGRLKRLIAAYGPDTIHIATEGPLGKAARRYCLRRKLPFTTCYHTQFPDYAAKRAAQILPALYGPVHRFTVNMLRKFHAPSRAVLVATASLEEQLRAQGYTAPLRLWARGVFTDIFHPGPKTLFGALPRPVALYVGRVAIEKNIDDFLSMDWRGSKVVVGDGPGMDEMRTRFPDAHFVGKKFGTELADHYRSADIFVFPSRTDTFGMVLTEALACGLPVAAYDVTGPRDIITAPFLGCLGDDLDAAALQALTQGSAQERYDYTHQHYSWDALATAFISIIRDSGAVITT
jgi:glycosyltransferase involved in cell wall biosynthesis